MTDQDLENLQKSHTALQRWFVIVCLTFSGLFFHVYTRTTLTLDELTVRDGIYVDDPDRPGWQKTPNGGTSRSPLIFIGRDDSRPQIFLGYGKKYIELGVDMDLEDGLTENEINPYFAYISFLDHNMTDDNSEIFSVSPQRRKKK